MAKFNKGILGGFSGTVGTVIGGQWKGMDIMRSRPSKRKGAQSLKQIAQQAKFTLMMKFVHPINALLSKTFGNFQEEKTAFNAAFSYNLKEAIGGVYPNFNIDYNKVLISRGSLLNGSNPTATAASNSHIDFAWGDNSTFGNAKPTDKAIVVLHCPDLKSTIYLIGAAVRSGLSLNVNAAGFKNHVVQSWLAFISDDESEASSSIYTGQVTVT